MLRLQAVIVLFAIIVVTTPRAQAAMEDHCRDPAGEKKLAIYTNYVRDILEGGKPETIGAYLGPGFVWRDAPKGTPEGPGPMRRQFDVLLQAFPDRRIETTFALCTDDLMTVHQTLTGSNTGPLLGYPASGRTHTVRHTETYRFSNNLIVEQWGEGLIPLLLLKSGWTLVWPSEISSTEHAVHSGAHPQ